MNRKFICLSFLLLTLTAAVKAQVAAGGAFSLEKTVTATGGGTSGNGSFTLTGTIGQNTAGNGVAGTPFGKSVGFWSRDPLATSAGVSIGGRVITVDGRGIRNARVTLTDAAGSTRTVLTGLGGVYRFNEIVTGETYILTVSAKRFAFANPTQVISVMQESDDYDFTAEPITRQ